VIQGSSTEMYGPSAQTVERCEKAVSNPALTLPLMCIVATGVRLYNSNGLGLPN
jgi:hypothetical protein